MAKIIYLRADNEAALYAALGDWWQDNHFNTGNPGDALVVIGTLYKDTEGNIVDENGVLLTPPEALPGYHANLMLNGEIPAAIEAIRIDRPANPRFVFAGVTP